MNIEMQDLAGNQMELSAGSNLYLKDEAGKDVHFEWADLPAAVRQELWQLAELAGETLERVIRNRIVQSDLV